MRGPWANAHWDLIVDLGFAGAGVYDEWSRNTGARVITLHQFEDREGYRWVKRGLQAGHGRLLDSMGLDWWEILAPCVYQEHQALYTAERLRSELGAGPVELAATRAHPHSHLVELATGLKARILEESPKRASPLKRIVSAARDLRPAQMIEIAFDKWDASYKVRGRLEKGRRANLKDPAILLPSAYSNVTRIQLAYAAQLAERPFLLATTRKSGESDDVPLNVEWVKLAAYAETSEQTTKEISEIAARWRKVAVELAEVEDLRLTFRARLWDFLVPQFETGLRLRDAWNTLLSTEPVSGVLCGDDLNYHTRLPLILAKNMGRKAIYCYHGSIDGGLLFKKPYADLNLVKGDMERDYMLRMGDVEREHIEVAAPRLRSEETLALAKNDLVVFSQPYEVTGGRAAEIYREILVPLSEVARQLKRRIILKLHPFESEKGRRRLLKSVLSPDQIAMVDISQAPASEVLRTTLLGIGLDSSVAVDCAQRGIPFFACGWLDFNGFEYMAQFERFGVATVLDAPQDILSIPQRLTGLAQGGSPDRLWQPAETARLDQILFGAGRPLTTTKCAC